MKIKRFSAKTMRHALRQVREEQGPDAVILSNRSVEGGVEVVAAVDYDETLIGRAVADVESAVSASSVDTADEPKAEPLPVAEPAEPISQPRFESFLKVAESVAESMTPPPAATQLDLSKDATVGALREDMANMRSLLEDQLSTLVWNKQARQDPKRTRSLRRLSALGIDADVARSVADQAVKLHGPENACRQILNVLAATLPVASEDLCNSGGVYAVVGPTGVGKTTSVAKMAARFALKHGRDALALVSTDSFRIGAQEQLATFAQILDVPVHLARDAQGLTKILRGLAAKKLVLIDTAGVSQRDTALDSSLAMLQAEGIAPKRLLALPANLQRETLHEVITRFGRQPLHGAIATKLDEAANYGAIFSNVIRHALPLTYLADGQRVPEDLHPASGKTLWWVKAAAQRLQQSGHRVEEATLARQFSEVTQHAYA
ncbi:MAG: flagellar biosynthesis protein FlhF [Gammaproteobacteria bacterium]